jgi:hypothetical protein
MEIVNIYSIERRRMRKGESLSSKIWLERRNYQKLEHAFLYVFTGMG